MGARVTATVTATKPGRNEYDDWSGTPSTDGGDVENGRFDGVALEFVVFDARSIEVVAPYGLRVDGLERGVSTPPDASEHGAKTYDRLQLGMND